MFLYFNDVIILKRFLQNVWDRSFNEEDVQYNGPHVKDSAKRIMLLKYYGLLLPYSKITIHWYKYANYYLL